ncbi:uncharacterized protein VTP21DRAFT_6184 [Calcarisporiella thermophila]|uniref:uncharacterized protein n=1 Tax=Calcarisporiella thermophila TaxID=911321 RepID=UPI0037433D25
MAALLEFWPERTEFFAASLPHLMAAIAHVVVEDTFTTGQGSFTSNSNKSLYDQLVKFIADKYTPETALSLVSEFTARIQPQFEQESSGGCNNNELGNSDNGNNMTKNLDEDHGLGYF